MAEILDLMFPNRKIPFEVRAINTVNLRKNITAVARSEKIQSIMNMPEWQKGDTSKRQRMFVDQGLPGEAEAEAVFAKMRGGERWTKEKHTMPEDFYQLVRIYGCTEPTVFEGRIRPTWEALHQALIEHLKAEPYDDEDGLFYLHIRPGKPVEMDAFSAAAMKEIREQVEEVN